MVLNIFLIPVCLFSIVKAIRKGKSSLYLLPAVLGRKGELLYDINLPESLDTFGILPLRFFFFLYKRKSLSCYLHTGYNIKFIQNYRNVKKLFK